MAADAGFGGRGEAKGYELFDSPAYIDDWLFQNQNATPVAILFHHNGTGGGRVSYSLQVNTTAVCNVIGVLDCSAPKFDLQARFERLVDQAVLRVASGVSTAELKVGVSDFPHPAGTLRWDVMRQYGNDWMYIAMVMNFVIQLAFVVMEKEKHLRSSMQQMGLSRTAYWLSWFISCEILNLVLVLLLCGFGAAVQFEFFLENAFSVYFTLFYLTATAFTLLAFFFSTLLSTTEAARSFGIVWYIMTFLAMPILVLFYFYSGSAADTEVAKGLSLISSAPFFKGVGDLIRASSGGTGKGMQWSLGDGEVAGAKVSDINYAFSGFVGTDPWYSMDDAYLALGYCCLLYATLAWYFDHVVPNVHGLAHHPFFFADPKYWGFHRPAVCGGGPAAAAPSGGGTVRSVRNNSSGPSLGDGADGDVAAEAARVYQSDFGDRGPVAVTLRNVKKQFNSRVYAWLYSNSWGGALAYGAVPAALFTVAAGAMASVQGFVLNLAFFALLLKFVPLSFRLRVRPTRQFSGFTAVKGVSYAIEDNSTFVLLGHNGAGKSTTFNMLTGLMPLSGGDAFIFGLSVTHEMHLISQIMGVCPQHDVLWDNLTGREHLELFAKLKNIPASRLKEEVNARLKDVSLEEAADVESGSYSGGMQRRLSLAIALLGDPKIVFLDEPTTGMDPVTRRSVWDCINRAKKGRVIILTTHSMEEADILGDRVAVMSGGQLSCIGTALHLKNKFGGGFRLSLAAPSANATKVKAFVGRAPGVHAHFVSETQGLFLFRLANSDAASLQRFFSDLEAQKASLGVSDLSIGNATLDDVFINLALAEEKDDDAEAEALLGGGLKAGGIKQAGPTVAGGEAVVAQPMDAGDPELAAAGIKQAGPSTTGGAGPPPAGGCASNSEACFFGPSRYCCDCGCCACEGCCGPAAAKETALREGSGGKLGKPQSQVAALVKKSIAFQLRQKKMMCCIIMFPTLFIALIALLGSLVFDPLTAKALKKYDWDCMQDLVKVTSYSGPGISVGGISDKNPLYENNDWPPLHGLEAPSFEYYVSYADGLASAVGAQTLGAQEVLPWERAYLAQFPKLKDCQDVYDEDYGAAVTRDSSGARLENDPASVRYAEKWAEFGNTSYAVWSAVTCKRGKNDATKATEDLRLLKGAKATPPTKATQHVYANLTAALAECQRKVTPMQSFNGSKSDAVLALQAATSTLSGVLQHLSFAPIQESLAKADFKARMAAALAAYAALAGGACEAVSNSSRRCAALGPPCAWDFWGEGSCDFAPGSVGQGTPSAAYAHAAAWLCARHDGGDAAATSSLGYGLVSGDEAYATVGVARADAFCAWQGGLDSARSQRATYAGASRAALHAKLYGDWEGVWDESTATHLTKFTSYHFAAADAATLQYDFTAYLNLSGLCGFYGGNTVECENSEPDAPTAGYLPANPVTDMLLAVQSRMASAVLAAATGFGLDVDLKSFPELLDKCVYDPLGCVSIVDFIATVFLPYIFLIYVYVIQGLVVFEKSSHLRDIMVMSGLKMRVYWTVLWAFYFVQYMAMVLVLWAAGAATSLKTFTIHDPIVLLLFFTLWGQCMIAFSFMLTTFFQSPRTATVVLLLVTVLSVQAGTTLLVQNIINPLVGDDEVPYLPYMWFPPLVMLRCLLWLAYGAAYGAPCTLANLGTYGNSAISRCFWYMFVETIIMAGLTYYFEAVLAAGGGAKHPLFCLTDLKAWATGSADAKASDAEAETAALERRMEAARADEPPDVQAERERALAGGPAQAVRVLNFRKVFAGQHGGAEKVAVRDLSFAVNKNECFGLLGHNGAGKTTCISMLCGLHKPSAGRAVVAGFDLETEMSSVHENMGVCPQHDILWNDLTAREHLLFFARLRKIPDGALNAAVAKALDAVNLKEWADVLSSKFSGGMKRRLSTACSLVGEPKVVYMDEPSTGLDPASRHRLWEVIAQSKGKNSILLTTHSMEEADVLCERIGIMGAGSMLCLGTSLDLKSRFGAGYRLSLHISDKGAAAAQKAVGVVVGLCPSATLLNEPLGGILDFEVPRAEVKLSKVYGAIEAARGPLGILDWGITESTLEEVFLAVTGHEAHAGVVPDAQAVAKAKGDLAAAL